MRSGKKERIHNTIDIGQITNLFSIAKEDDLLVAKDLMEKPADKPLARIPYQLALAIGVRQTQGAGLDPVNPVINSMIQLCGILVYAIDIDRQNRMLLVHGEALRPAIELPRAAIHNARARIHRTAAFQQAKVRFSITLKIPQWISHGIDVADMAGQIENDVYARHRFPQPGGFLEIERVDLNGTSDPIEIIQVAPAPRME
jgi:hypothetical protein